MKTVILAGGLGTRLSEETSTRPKPMVEIGGHPMLWHIMNIYGAYGFNEFVIALGYRADVVKRYFADFHLLENDLTIDTTTGRLEARSRRQSSWTVHLVETGANTQTGGRVRRLREWIGDERFMLTYGDGLANVNIQDLVAFHRSHGKLATVTGVLPPSRFGEIELDETRVRRFAEKPERNGGWINGGFFVLEPDVFDLLDGDGCIWERDPLASLAATGQLEAYLHDGFFQPMDTLREKHLLESLWNSGNAPWKVW